MIYQDSAIWSFDDQTLTGCLCDSVAGLDFEGAFILFYQMASPSFHSDSFLCFPSVFQWNKGQMLLTLPDIAVKSTMNCIEGTEYKTSSFSVSLLFFPPSFCITVHLVCSKFNAVLCITLHLCSSTSSDPADDLHDQLSITAQLNKTEWCCVW